MSQASDEQLEKVKEWQEKYAQVNEWYKTMTPKIEGNFNVGKTLPVVRKQIAEQEVLARVLLVILVKQFRGFFSDTLYLLRKSLMKWS